MATTVLSDEQIEELLQEAETRLRQRAGEIQHVESDNVISLQDQQPQFEKRKPLPQLQHNLNRAFYIQEKDGVAQTNSDLMNTKDKTLADNIRLAEVKHRSKAINDKTTSGPEWFDIPKTNLTPQMKRDLQLLELRSVLDPHRHYKKNTRKGKTPTFSQVGTVIEGPTEWYSSRINRKDRVKNFVEEALVTERETGRFKNKYAEIQEKKTSGKKAHYKKLMERRKKKV